MSHCRGGRRQRQALRLRRRRRRTAAGWRPHGDRALRRDSYDCLQRGDRGLLARSVSSAVATRNLEAGERGAAAMAYYCAHRHAKSSVFGTFQVANGELRRGPDVQHHPLLRETAGCAVCQGLRRQPLVGGQQAQGRRGAVVRGGLPGEGGVVVAGQRGFRDCRRRAARYTAVRPASIAGFAVSIVLTSGIKWLKGDQYSNPDI